MNERSLSIPIDSDKGVHGVVHPNVFAAWYRRRAWCARVAAELRAEHEWLADTEDDEHVIDRYHATLDADGNMP